MYVILVYDVDQKRTSKMLKLCRRYLSWIQNSVFEGQISEVQLKQLALEAKRRTGRGSNGEWWLPHRLSQTAYWTDEACGGRWSGSDGIHTVGLHWPCICIYRRICKTLRNDLCEKIWWRNRRLCTPEEKIILLVSAGDQNKRRRIVIRLEKEMHCVGASLLAKNCNKKEKWESWHWENPVIRFPHVK